MPHSSGGGSHSSGSHSSSHSSHSSSSHSGSGSSGPRISNKPFRNSRTFVYYRNNTPHYVYSDRDMTKMQEPKATRFFTLIVLLPILLFGAFMTYLGIGGSVISPLKNTEQYEILIDDRANVLGDTADLQHSLEVFKEKTGITPAIVTVTNDYWMFNYSNLEAYAYDVYVNNFADETHWLIVYSEPVVVGEPAADGSGNVDLRDWEENGQYYYYDEDDFVDWHWEGMIGDDTDSALPSDLQNSFNDELHRELTSSQYTVNEALCNSFDLISADYGEFKFSLNEESLPLILFGAFSLFMVFVAAKGIIGKKKDYTYSELQEVVNTPNAAGGMPYQQGGYQQGYGYPGGFQNTPYQNSGYQNGGFRPQPETKIAKCEYCGGEYVAGSGTKCPFCGAEISK